MSVVLDTVGTEVAQNAVTSVTAANENVVGSGLNRALVVILLFSSQAVSGVSVTWDSGGTNQAMTLIKTANTPGTNGRIELWGLVNPTSGTLALVASWTGTADVQIIGVSWTGVNQTGGTTSFPHSTSATGTASTNTLTITSTSGNATMAAGCNDADNFSSTGQTQIYIDNTQSSANGAASRAAGAATVTHTLNTSTTTGHWAEVGTDIAALGDTQEWFGRSVDARSSRVDGPHVMY